MSERKDAEPPARKPAPPPAPAAPERPPSHAEVEEMGGEAPCQLPRFWDADADD